MLLASLLVPIAVAAIVLLVQRLRLPVFLALMATIVVYGIAADMTFQSVGKAFGLGFTAALEQVGLLVVAGASGRRWCCDSRSAPARRLRRERWRVLAHRQQEAWLCCSRPARKRHGGPGAGADAAGLCRSGCTLAPCRRCSVGDEGDTATILDVALPVAVDRDAAGLVARRAASAGERRRRADSDGRGSPSASRWRC